MEANGKSEGAIEMFRAQAHIYKHACNYVNSMVLATAIQLNIPDIIHTHGKPITIPKLVSALKLPPHKSNAVYRLMRLLTHNGFFDSTKLNKAEEEKEDGYVLTASSRLLLKTQIPNLSPFALFAVHPVMLAPWKVLGDWFSRNEESTAFETAHGAPLWEFCDSNPKFNNVFNEGMASDSQMMRLIVKDCGRVFEGVGTLVDVGGGTGMIAKLILGAFPSLKCTVLDLPHVVADKPGGGSENLRFLGGDMFHSIPSADAIMFKHIMHDWSDEECVKILKKGREAIIADKNDGVKKKGKVIIIGTVLGAEEDNETDITEMKLIFDLLMMVHNTGRERTEMEYEKLFTESGFTHYKITPIFGLMSLIEVFP
ncbi:PREDICTED: trans-resveratrol di-O-methyltransferase-like isoform X3 [Ipomoea nil]|uniref:trans-resveratrol di-O-methyltransferase-like isoform X3 n=1 Tax=Ipomoea nil TaxID=35883 RepID=UPI000900E7FC|nr:PREDICTED: trans-resveratrol di-O-methyltransferase-like isoform X3 [Ipomoea nil]